MPSLFSDISKKYLLNLLWSQRIFLPLALLLLAIALFAHDTGVRDFCLGVAFALLVLLAPSLLRLQFRSKPRQRPADTDRP